MTCETSNGGAFFKNSWQLLAIVFFSKTHHLRYVVGSEYHTVMGQANSNRNISVQHFSDFRMKTDRHQYSLLILDQFKIK